MILNFPRGEIYKNSIEDRNSIAFTDNPNAKEIIDFFRMWEDAEVLIYAIGKKIKATYFRKDFG